MEDYTNYTNILSAEERALLENLINKLAISGVKQYNTQAAIILFKNFGSSVDNMIKMNKEATLVNVDEVRESFMNTV